MPLPQRRDTLATLTFTQVVKIFLPLRKIIKINSENDSDDYKNEVHQFILTEGTGLSVYNNGKTKNNKNENISLAFTVNNVDDEYKRLLEIGVSIIQPPTTQPWGARNMLFIDHDGNQIYFRSFPK